ncbi:unknown [Prevotella sp. CAG:1092]|nr:unknown [Prevotella sp. CAG:1092]
MMAKVVMRIILLKYQNIYMMNIIIFQVETVLLKD